MIETILVGSDGSEGAASAERFGVALAARLRARLSGCTVVEDRDVRAPDAGGAGGGAADGGGAEAFSLGRPEHRLFHSSGVRQ